MRSNNSRNLTVILLGFIALYAFMTLNKISKLITEQIAENQLSLTTLIVKPNIDPNTDQPVPITAEDMESTKSILKKRLDAIDELEFTIDIDGEHINISTPGLSKRKSRKIIQPLITRAKLSFHAVHRKSSQLANEVAQGKEISGYRVLPHKSTDIASGKTKISNVLVKNAAPVNGSDVKIAWVDPRNFSTVNIQLTSEGGDKMRAFTLSLTQDIDQIATVLNDNIINTATLKATPLGRNFVINGLDSKKEAESLVAGLQNLLKYDIEIIEQPNISSKKQ